MNDSGQAYSTFKLLIAAIVALAILMILMPIIGSIFQIFQDDPADKTIELLNAMHNKPETIKTTARDVTFAPNTTLSAASLANSVPLSKNQICLTTGDFEGTEDFEWNDDPGHHRIIWHGASNQNAKIAVTCNINLDLLKDGIDGTIFENWDTSDCDICKGKGRCCIVALVNP